MSSIELTSMQLKKRDLSAVLHPISSIAETKKLGPQIMVSGQGCYITDSDGGTYLSADAGLGATTLGFGQEPLAKVYGAAPNYLSPRG